MRLSLAVGVVAQVIAVAILLSAGVMNLAEWNKGLSITMAVITLVIAYNVISFPSRNRKQKLVRYALLANPCAVGFFAAIVLVASDDSALFWIAGGGMIAALLVSFVLVGLSMLAVRNGPAESY